MLLPPDMARFRFRVAVPFQPFLPEGLDGPRNAQMGRGVRQVGDLQLEHGEELLSTAVVEVEADTLDAAEEEGVARVGQLMRVLAVGDHAFIISLSKVHASPLGPIVDRNEGLPGSGNVVADDFAFLGERPVVTITIHNVTFEDRALKTNHSWPVHLRRSLDLNYAAILALERDVRFLLSAAALDVLTWGTLGKTHPLLKTRLGKRYDDEFKRSFEKLLSQFLSPYGLSDSDVSRLSRHTLDTHDESTVDRVSRYLDLRAVRHSVADVKKWWKLRGQLAHGDSVDEELLKAHLGNLQSAVRLALHNELDSISENPRDEPG